jgi:hypothetical protein
MMSDATEGQDLRLWTKDEAGQAVLRGLTAAETEWYLEFSEKELARRIGMSQPWADAAAFEEDRARWRALNRTHEHARAQVIFVEEQARLDAEEAKSRNKRAKRRY